MEAACSAGIEVLAVTDHDSIAALPALRSAVADQGEAACTLITGSELSMNWQGRCVHVLLLGFDESNPVLLAWLAEQHRIRAERNLGILSRLDKATGHRIAARFGVVDGYILGDNAEVDAVLEKLCRPQIAEELVSLGLVQKPQQAFKRWLGAGKPASVSTPWPELERALPQLASAGGVSVLAHPMKYGLTGRKTRRLCEDFASAGGQGLEVVSGAQPRPESQQLAKVAQGLDLCSSIGSDFHAPRPWLPFGKLPELPSDCEPVWQRYPELF